MTIRFGSPFSSPFDRLLTLQREIERARENPSGFDLGLTGGGVFPPVNVFQENDGYLVRIEVPGVSPDQLKVENYSQTLTISGEREAPVIEGASYHRRERGAGKFSRSLTLPNNLDVSQAQASLKHGILSIRVPLKATAKPHQIEVQAA